MRQDLKFDVDRTLFPFESKFVDSRGGASIHFPNHEHHALHASHFWQDDQGEVAADHIIDWAKRRGWIG